jgi:[acyl-carrier-protein] S-malonyltransferase
MQVIMRRVFVFPGQGSQSVGMLAELAARHGVVNETFAEASAVLGYDLWQLVQQGPAEKLAETVIQQPAMLTAGVATWRYWQASGGFTPDVVCGHSLGEFSALVAAGALDLPTAVGLVKRRAELMQEAVPVGIGAIAAVLGLEDEPIAAACRQAAQGDVVELVNHNSPGQAVIAGHTGAVQRALDLCKAAGAKRAVVLPMSVPAHSALMRPAAERFGAVIAAAAMRQPSINYWSPVDGAAHSGVDDIRALLTRQLASPVRWTGLIRALANAGATTFIECGPGKALTGLNRRIEKGPEVQCLALQDPAAVDAALAVQG